MVIYIDDILLMAEQVTLHLEALLYLLTGLGFIINVPKSLTSPTQQSIPGPLGALYYITFGPVRVEAPPHQDGSKPDPAERSGDNWLK